MELNGWTINDDNAVHRVDLTTPDGETTIIMVAVGWEEGPENLLQVLEEDETINAMPPMVGEFKPGLTIRMMINGEPMAVISMNAVEGEDQSLETFATMNSAGNILESLLQVCRESDDGNSSVTSMEIKRTIEKNYAVEEILEWPGTPTHQRYLTAMEFLESNPSLLDEIEEEIIEETLNRKSQTGRDVLNLIGVELSSEFGRWAITELAKQGAKSWHDSHELIELLTWKGSSSRTIGTAINTSMDSRREVFSLTWMQRHPDWMGFCVNLKELGGTQALVMESPIRRGKPGIVMASITGHPNTPRLEKATDRFPTGKEASTLRDILTWHGVEECLWLPAEWRTRRKRRWKQQR